MVWQRLSAQRSSGAVQGVHLDVIDGDIPISFILSSASLHDSQVAIPLAQMTAERIANLYDLSDAAYDAKEIREMSARLGHVAIIDRNPRRGEKIASLGSAAASKSPLANGGKAGVWQNKATFGSSYARGHRTVCQRTILTYRTPCGDRHRRATRGVLQEPHYPIRISFQPCRFSLRFSRPAQYSARRRARSR
jgi:hypothetical protein